MGEVLFAVVLLLIVIVGLAAAFTYFRSSDQQRKALNRAPAVILPDGEPPDVLLANATRNYLLAQRAVRILDRLLSGDGGKTITDRAARKEMQALVDEFYASK